MRFKWLLLLTTVLCARDPYQEPWGHDAGIRSELAATSPRVSAPVAVRIADAVIRFHQDVISPVDGPRSHFRPTSSRYMQLAMHRYGFFKGYVMGCDRLLRENEEEWVYRTVEIDGISFKYDPAWTDKYHR